MDQVLVVSKPRYRVYRYALQANGRYEQVWSTRCAFGMDRYPTPNGVFKVVGKALNPDWQLPDSDWVEPEWRGKVIPGGDPANPLKGAFLDLGFLGIGIHGTADIDSLGTRASHGCIRVTEKAAIKLYHAVPNGTIVTIL